MLICCGSASDIKNTVSCRANKKKKSRRDRDFQPTRNKQLLEDHSKKLSLTESCRAVLFCKCAEL